MKEGNDVRIGTRFSVHSRQTALDRPTIRGKDFELQVARHAARLRKSARDGRRGFVYDLRIARPRRSDDDEALCSLGAGAQSRGRRTPRELVEMITRMICRMIVASTLVGSHAAVTFAQALYSPNAVKLCTLNTCSIPALVINVSRSDAMPAAYVVALEYEGQSLRCVPEKAGQLSDRISPNCGDSARVFVQDDHEIVGIFRTPARVKVTLIEQEKIIATREFIPDYKISYPNGMECPSQCKNWSVDWTIP